MKILMRILSFLTAFILFISLVTFQLSFAIHHKVLDSGLYLDKFERYKLYSDMQNYISVRIGNLTSNKKVSQSITGGIITENWVTGESKFFVSGIIDYLKGTTGSIPVINYDEPVERLSGNINRIIKDDGIKSDILENAIINSLRNNSESIMPKIPFSSKWDEKEKQEFIESAAVLRRALSNTDMVLYASLTLALLTFIILWILNRNLAGISIFSAGFFTAAASAFALIIIKLSILEAVSIVLAPLSSALLQDIPSIKLIAVSIINELLYFIIISGCILSVLGIITPKIFYSKVRPN